MDSSVFANFALDYYIGAALVAFYAYTRINKPKIDMASTTVQRYWSNVAIYVAASVILFLLSSALLAALKTSIQHHQNSSLNTFFSFFTKPEASANLSPPLLVALFMTILLPKTPWLVYLDENIRTFFRRRASMSSIAAHLSHIIENTPFKVPDDKREEITKHLEGQEIEAKDVNFDNDDSPQYLWTRINALLLVAKQWETDIVYSKFVEKYRKEWETLLEESKQHEEKAIRCFRLGCIAGDDEKLISALKDCRYHYTEQLKGLLTKLSDFMGRGIAQCNRTPEARRAALLAIGFDARVNVAYTFDQIAWIFFTVLLTTIVAAVFLNLILPSGQHNAPIKAYMFKIAFSYTCASLVALFAYYRKQNPALPIKYRPWARYFVSGVIAVLLATILGFLVDILNQLLYPASGTGMADILHTQISYEWIFQIRTFMLVIVLSYLLDTPAKLHRRRQQWAESAITGAVMLGTGFIILSYLQSSALQKTAKTLQNTPHHTFKLIAFFLFLSLLLGTIVGYWLPTNVRRTKEAAREIANNQTQASSAVVVN